MSIAIIFPSFTVVFNVGFNYDVIYRVCVGNRRSGQESARLRKRISPVRTFEKETTTSECTSEHRNLPIPVLGCTFCNLFRRARRREEWLQEKLMDNSWWCCRRARGHQSFCYLALRFTNFSVLLFSFTEFPRAEHWRRGPDDAHRGTFDQHSGHEARTGVETSLEVAEETQRAVQLHVVQHGRPADGRRPDRVQELHQQLHENDNSAGGQRRFCKVLIVARLGRRRTLT